eukprot:6192274-Pleurochrysis_carterae.AAC.2
MISAPTSVHARTCVHTCATNGCLRNRRYGHSRGKTEMGEEKANKSREKRTRREKSEQVDVRVRGRGGRQDEPKDWETAKLRDWQARSEKWKKRRQEGERVEKGWGGRGRGERASERAGERKKERVSESECVSACV